MLQALIDKRIGRRDQAQAWVWRLAGYTRELHEEYAVQRWPETKRLLGLLVNSSGRAHGRNARRLVHAARKQDRRLAVALLAAAVSHTPEGEEVLRGARMRMARKPSAVARELLRNFPKGGKRRRKRKRGEKGDGENGSAQNGANGSFDDSELMDGEATELEGASNGGAPEDGASAPKRKRRGRRKSQAASGGSGADATTPSDGDVSADGAADAEGSSADADPSEKPKRARRGKATKAAQVEDDPPVADVEPTEKPKRARRKAKTAKDGDEAEAKPKASKAKAKPKVAAKPKRKRKAKAASDGDSEAGQMDIPGTEGDAAAIGESDE
jgi:hypothetical protein